MFQINKGDIGFKVAFLLPFILFSWNILKVNLCIHIYIRRFMFLFLSSTKGEENEGDLMAKV
jgi:hypothetical protein